MLDTSENLAVCAAEIGCPVEQLLSPLTRFTRRVARPGEPPLRFSMDNGGFGYAPVEEFIALLLRERDARHLCRFVAVPDVVAVDKRGRATKTARRTLEMFRVWKYRTELNGWPLALVMQDGQEDFEIPWNEIRAVFIGGSTEWKESKCAADCIRAAKWAEKWVHAGRVNTPGRFEYFEELGADSIDGSGLARYSWMRERIYKSHTEPTLFTENEHARNY